MVKDRFLATGIALLAFFLIIPATLSPCHLQRILSNETNALIGLIDQFNQLKIRTTSCATVSAHLKNQTKYNQCKQMVPCAPMALQFFREF